MGRVPQLGMCRNRRIAVLLQLGPQDGMIVWRDGAPTARRPLCEEGIGPIPSAARKEALNGGETDTKRGCDVCAWHPALNRRHKALA